MSHGIWRAVGAGDLAEVERLVGQHPGLLNAGDNLRVTPLMIASREGHVGVVRWLLDHGAVINEADWHRCTAVWYACDQGHIPVVRLLLDRGADPTIADQWGSTPLVAASSHLEVVRLLLGHPRAKATLNRRNSQGRTALWEACFWGRGGVARALLESGADETMASNNGTTPMAITKRDPPPHQPDITAEGRGECVAALEVRSLHHRDSAPSC
jgi:uncharacterized protein